jgi:hypothetical protein
MSDEASRDRVAPQVKGRHATAADLPGAAVYTDLCINLMHNLLHRPRPQPGQIGPQAQIERPEPAAASRSLGPGGAEPYAAPTTTATTAACFNAHTRC